MDFDGIDLSQYMPDYLAELNEQLEELNDALLQLETSTQDHSPITREIFRLAHTIKGSAGTMGFHSIAEVAHAFEDLLSEIQEETVPLSDDVFDAMLAAFDDIRNRANCLNAGEELSATPSHLVQRIRALAQSSQTPPAPPPLTVGDDFVLPAHIDLSELDPPAPPAPEPVDDFVLPPHIDLSELDPPGAPAAPEPSLEIAPASDFAEEGFHIDLSQYFDDYRAELDEQLEAMSEALLALEHTPQDAALINELFRLSHTIKGAAATMGFEPIANLSMAFEDLLEAIRSGDIQADPEVFPYLLRGYDGLLALSQALPENNPHVQVEPLCQALHSILASGGKAPPAPAAPATPPPAPAAPLPVAPPQGPGAEASPMETLRAAEAELHAQGGTRNLIPEPIEDASSAGSGELYRVIMRFALEQEMRSVRAYLVLNHVQEVAELIQTTPPVAQVEEDQLGEVLEMILRTEISVEELKNILSFGEADSVEIHPMAAGQPVPALPSQAAALPPPSAPPPQPAIPEEPPPPPTLAEIARRRPPPPPKEVEPVVDEAPRARVDPSRPLLEQLSEEMKTRVVECLNSDFNVLEVTVLLNDSGERSGARALTILNYLRNHAQVISFHPPEDEIRNSHLFQGVLQCLVATDSEVDQLRELALAEEVEKSTFTPIALHGLEIMTTEEAHKRAAAQKAQERGASKASGATRKEMRGNIPTVRVTVDRLDHLMNLVAELVISKTQLQQLVTHFDNGAEREQFLSRMVEVNSRLSRITTDLQEGIMKARMVQIGQVFFRFTRLVRDLSKSLGKNVEFLIEGTETELDKTVIDEIGDPLMHLIRNSLDHGVESPEERIRKGKPPKGILLLKASHAGDHIVVETADDGRGMDAEAIKASAIRKGLVSEGEAKKMSNQEAFNLIFMPGFSTAQEVSAISGRGVGMDVVKTTVESLGGEIQVKSEPNVGTSIQIKLPLTLAIIQGLLVSVGGESFSIPLSTVKETIQLREGMIHTFNGFPAMVFRGELITLLNLSDFFGLPKTKAKKRFIVFAGVDEERIGIVVDSLIGRREIVIKSLDKTFMDVKGFAGATVLGDGQVSLILDVPALMEESKRFQYEAGKTIPKLLN